MFDNPELEKAFMQWLARERSGGSYDSFLVSNAYRKLGGSASTIYSCNNEAERKDLEVPLQRSFAGPSHVISSNLADTRLSDLGSEGILRQMNKTLGTDRCLIPEMRRLLRFCRRTLRDFGQVYALLRPRWHMRPAEMRTNIKTHWTLDKKLRSRALDNDIVVGSRTPPRRLWDLWSNRVVPFWVIYPFESDTRLYDEWIAISHSWTDEKLRHEVHSPVNGYAWPIPIPIDTSLERIRVEILNLMDRLERTGKANFVWLDVLCLRQEGVALKEDLRKAEWKLDVPTIGPIYERADWTVYYFSGLGRPFTSPTDRKDPRLWMNRAWTLQETQKRIIIAGRSPSSPNIPYATNLNDSVDWQRRMNELEPDDVMESLMRPFTSIASRGETDWSSLSLMRHRSATNELDKIAGLIFRFNEFQPPLPAYIIGEKMEDAWDRLIKATQPNYRAQLFFLYPKPGRGKHVWYPSWKQITDMDVLPRTQVYLRDIQVHLDDSNSTYRVYCYSLEDCLVEGLSKIEGSSRRSPTRSGTVRVVDKEGQGHTFSISVNHQTSIPVGYYTLVGYAETYLGYSEWLSYWVVARKPKEGVVEKKSVVDFEGRDTYEAMRDIAEGFGKTSLELL